MDTVLKERISKRKDGLSVQLKDNLLQIANAVTPVWKEASKLDNVLFDSLINIPKCKLIFAVECHGIQVSSNILPNGKINTFSRGQNLANRPYMLNMNPDDPFSLSPVYISQSDHKPSITAMHQVFDKLGNKLGCIAVDFNIDDLPESATKLVDSNYWRQIKGDPAIRQNLFQQERVTSSMDEQIHQVHDIINNLICKRGIFHAKLHYSSSRATLWLYDLPHEYRLHVLNEIIDPDVCLAYPAADYPKNAKTLPNEIYSVLEKFKSLRYTDETVYLRSGSINIINGMVGLNFSCDGSHYMPVTEFLEKPNSFWFGV